MREAMPDCEKRGPYVGKHAHMIAVASSTLVQSMSPASDTRECAQPWQRYCARGNNDDIPGSPLAGSNAK